MRLLKLTFVMAAAVTLSGCLAADTLIKVKADGSGTIEQTVLVSTNALDMMGGMAAMGGEGKGALPADMFDESKLREAASRLGEDVRFVSSQPLETNGMKGVKAIYAFTDVSRIKVSPGPDLPVGAPQGTQAESLSFKMTKGAAGSVLTITMPQPKEDAKATGTPSAPESMPPEAAGMMEMMKSMMKGMRVAVAVEVAGTIAKTNAQHRTGSRVTLLEVDMDTLMQDPAMMQSLQGKMRPGASAADLQAAIAGVKGVKMSGPTVTIEWR